MGGVLGRVVDRYADSDDDHLPIEVELMGPNDHAGENEVIEMPPAEAAPSAAASPLLFGGNLFLNGNPNNPVNEVMGPLLRRLASNTPQLSRSRTVTCPFNVNKGSIKLVPRVTTTNPVPSTTLYDLQFTFDATEPCVVKVFFCVDEQFSNQSFDYFDANTGEKISTTPSTSSSSRLLVPDVSSSPVGSVKFIEKRFELGLGQTFFTLESEALDITKYSLSNLTWNQLEQQLEADKIHTRSDGNSSDASEASSDEEEQDGDENDERNDAPEPASDDDTVPLTSVDDEESGISVASSSSASQRRRRRRRRAKRARLPARPRPKPVTDVPLVVRTLFPVVITIEPVLEDGEKAVVEAQITHICLTTISTTRNATPEAGTDHESGSTDHILSSGEVSNGSATAASSSDPLKDLRFDCRVLRQKLLVNGSVYNVYDIYGVDSADINPNGANGSTTGDLLDGGLQSTCVICMSEPRTTLVIPCRHMCLCEDCAETLKVQSVKCPICRGPVRSLLKVDLSTSEDDENDHNTNGDDAADPTVPRRHDGHKRFVASSDSEPEDSLANITEDDDNDDDDDDDNVRSSLVRGARLN